MITDPTIRTFCLTAMLVLSGTAQAQDESANAPLTIARQGSLEAGGETVFCATNDGGDPNSKRWPQGHIVINQVYATYQYPIAQKFKFPILFNPGGGHTARVYDTTPDGREGWLTLFLREGFATYGVDRVNTGRAGSDICKINAVKLGRAPPSELPAMNRYAAESAWVTFRWGPEFGKPYPDTQFPIEAADNYYPQTVTTYRDPQELRKSVNGLAALLDKVGPATLQTWSSSGLMGYLTAVERPQLVKGILAVETSPTAFEEIPDAALKTLAQVPIVIVIGDRAQDRVDASRAFQKRMQAVGGDVTVDVLPEAGIRGNGHTLMLEKNNKQIMDRMISWLKAHVYKGE
jgi:pimeloyl-ACP methyl ester carboxylesterase